jgi:hypothetical protein
MEEEEALLLEIEALEEEWVSFGTTFKKKKHLKEKELRFQSFDLVAPTPSSGLGGFL